MKNKYEKMFFPGALKVPAKILKKNQFCAASSFQGPRELLLDGYCTPIENQGSLPYCAAYAASSFAESILWRMRGYHKDIDPVPLYKYAKSIDGDPYGDGTTLDAALSALTAKGYFDGSLCRVKTFGGTVYGNVGALNDLKYAIHKYGCVEIGMCITDKWYSPRNGVIQSGGVSQGGHAILACGYDEEGVLILNSWGADWGHEGKAYVPNGVFESQFMYGSVLTHVLDGLE